jgi:hypothetical protein
VEQFTMRVFGLPSTEFFPKHKECLQHLRHLLAPGCLPALLAKFSATFLRNLRTLPHDGQVPPTLYLMSHPAPMCVYCCESTHYQ